MSLHFDAAAQLVAQHTLASDQDDDASPKGCLFSPDGLMLLSTRGNKHIVRYSLPGNTFTASTDEDADNLANSAPWAPSWVSREAEPMYDYAWYPQFNCNDAATTVFATACKEQPIHLHEAFYSCEGNGPGGSSAVGASSSAAAGAGSAGSSAASGQGVTQAIRASYGGHNHRDELDTAYSLCFSGDGRHLFAGYDHAIMRFDLARPGRETDRWLTTPFRRSKQGQKGIIGAIAAAPSGSTSASGVVAAGSYDGSLWLYGCSTGGQAVSKLKYKQQDLMPELDGSGLAGGAKAASVQSTGSVEQPSAVSVTSQQRSSEAEEQHRPSKRARTNAGSSAADREAAGAGAGAGAAHSAAGASSLSVAPPPSSRPSGTATGRPGVTRVLWSPDGQHLYAGFRSAGAILCWDIRRTDTPVISFPRDNWSQQRIGFDVDYTGRQLLTGGRDGVVRCYDTATGNLIYKQDGFADAVNGVSINPVGVVYACAVGQRHDRGPSATGTSGGASANDDDDADEDEAAQGSSGAAEAGSSAARPVSSISLWRTKGATQDGGASDGV